MRVTLVNDKEVEVASFQVEDYVDPFGGVHGPALLLVS